MGFNKQASNKFWDGMQSLISSARGKKKFQNKAARSGLDKMQSAVDAKNYDSIKLMKDQLDSGIGAVDDMANKTFSAEIFKTGDSIKHNTKATGGFTYSNLEKL